MLTSIEAPEAKVPLLTVALKLVTTAPVTLVVTVTGLTEKSIVVPA